MDTDLVVDLLVVRLLIDRHRSYPLVSSFGRRGRRAAYHTVHDGVMLEHELFLVRASYLAGTHDVVYATNALART